MDKLFLGISSHVVSLSKTTGEELWKTKLKTSTVTNVYCENEHVFAYAGGHLFSLNATDGSIIWENTLKGLGYGTCIIASQHQNSALIAEQVATQQALAATTVATSAATTSNS
ncbi:PQQ-binding-like beta-propeller repeat protein [Shewanella waksmanii]|uniref:outer membrane protein assembly factor BamB family protein n=1 Tax=Shewanella waksmanii TaxID=213783 RepID=UPI003736BDBB